MSHLSVPRISGDVEQFYRKRPVLVTGGTGFLGHHILELLRRLQANVVFADSNAFDLRSLEHAAAFVTSFEAVYDEDAGKEPILFHLAAQVSGIHSTSAFPAKHLEDNVRMTTNILNAAAARGIHYIVAAGSVCGYPEYAPMPMIEKNFWNGKPEPTNFSYGMAKRYAWALLDSYKRERRIQNFAYLASANLYGPFDDFDPKTSHVIPALIRNASFAAEREQPLEVWGSGKASRDFLYVWDAAIAYVLAGYAVKQQSEDIFVNIGTGYEVTIDYLARRICELMEVHQGIIYDEDRPDGQARRCLDITNAKEILDWKPITDIKDGLKKTIAYYDEYIRDDERQISGSP